MKTLVCSLTLALAIATLILAEDATEENPTTTTTTASDRDLPNNASTTKLDWKRTNRTGHAMKMGNWTMGGNISTVFNWTMNGKQMFSNWTLSGNWTKGLEGHKFNFSMIGNWSEMAIAKFRAKKPGAKNATENVGKETDQDS